uniref:DUF7745 domain-containing protein n=1 Tax=Nicotiana tabacum TaxID=4097 RepID=A0A1S3ZZH8_TOBAC|nr:PREDICTED: uncharacterized protein LOC107792172 [Nicotiana tabacum]
MVAKHSLVGLLLQRRPKIQNWATFPLVRVCRYYSQTRPGLLASPILRVQMEISHNIPNISMVMGAPHKLKQWWRNILQEHGNKIRTHLGSLTALMNIQATRVLTRLLIEFWDLARTVFKFVDCELTPTIEEVTSFTKLPFAGRKPILSVIMPNHRFLNALNGRSNKKLRSVEDG